MSAAVRPTADILVRIADDGMLELRLPEPPSSNRWWRNVKGRMVTSREARQYKEAVSLVLTARRVQPIPAGTPVKVAIVWWRGRKAGDLDKRVGVLLDALQGTAYVSDAQIVELVARREDAKHCPRVDVHVWPLGAVQMGMARIVGETVEPIHG